MTVCADEKADTIDDDESGVASDALQWVRDLFSSSEYEPYQQSTESSPSAVSELTSNIHLVAIIATGVMILSALALLLALIAVLRDHRSQPLWVARPGGPWLANGVQVYPSPDPTVLHVGHTPAHTGLHPDDHQLVPIS